MAAAGIPTDPLPFNDRALNFSPFEAYKQHTVAERTICKYLLSETSDDSLKKAASAINQLVKDNGHFCATFSLTRERIIALLRTKPYLVINGSAVSLTSVRDTESCSNPNFKDKYFTEALIKNPSRCPRGHSFERDLALIWKKQKGDVCPAGPTHTIGALAVDEDLKHDITAYRTAQESVQQRDREVADALQRQQLLNAASRLEIAQLQRQLPDLPSLKTQLPLLLAATGKVTIKLGGKTVCKTGGKLAAKLFTQTATKAGAKAAGKTAAKAVPFIGLLIGLGLGLYRVHKGQYLAAVAEIASGAVAMFPGPGTAASVAIDLGLAGHDAHVAYAEASGNGSNEGVVDLLPLAYALIGIDLQQTPNPTKAEVDASYRESMRIVHPDGAIDGAVQDDLTRATQLINEAKDTIYAINNWD